MKKILKNIILLITCFMGVSIINVNAATIAVGNDSALAGTSDRSVTVELKDTDLSEYTEVEFQLDISGTTYAEIIRFSPKTGTGLNIETLTGDTIVYRVKSDSGLHEATIGTISYKTTEQLNSNFTIKPTNVKFKKADGTVVGAGDAGIKVQEGTIKYEAPKSTDATLTSLTISQGTLSPEFKPEVTEYKATVADTINQIRLSVVTAKGATQVGSGVKSLKMGENKFEIVVTAEDKTTKKTYTIIVNRGQIAEPSAYLKSLVINNIGCVLSPEFDKMNNKYTVDVTDDITELDLKYELEDEAATVSIEGNENFKVGANTILIKIKSSDEKEDQTYEITVNVTEKESAAPIVEEKPEEKKKNPWIIVIIVIVILLIVGGIAFVLFKKKKDGNKKDKDLPKSNDVKETDEYEPKHESVDGEDSVTDILKGELFDDERTSTYDKDLFKEGSLLNNEEELEKTKEFNFRDLD